MVKVIQVAASGKYLLIFCARDIGYETIGTIFTLLTRWLTCKWLQKLLPINTLDGKFTG